MTKAVLDVLYQLHKTGYQAYLVGGGVRDALIGRVPKDFDVATNATPEQVKGMFRRCRIIGRRFRLAHVYSRHELIEVATFRAAQDTSADQPGILLRDNEYGSIEEDAQRRDITINAIYYNIADYSIVDYANGMQDIQARIIRLIGEPSRRYQEDPVRMLRVIRFAAKLQFAIEPATAAPIATQGQLLTAVPAARLTDEIHKLFMLGHGWDTYTLLQQHGLYSRLFPLAADPVQTPAAAALIEHGLRNTDQRIHKGLPSTPAYLYAILLWESVRRRTEHNSAQGMDLYPAHQQAAIEIVAQQNQTVSIPKRYSTMAREIWAMQASFNTTKGRRPARMVKHPRFRAAYDFMLLRAHAGEIKPEIAAWWTDYQAKYGPKPSVARRRK